MGEKGSKLTGEAGTTAEAVVAELSALGGVSSRKMFGGYGIFQQGAMFGLVNSAGAFYLKAGDTNRSKFEAAGAHQHGKMPYFSVPEDVLNDPEALIAWSRESADIAQAGKKK